MSRKKWGWIWFRRGLKPAMAVLGPRFDSVHLHQKTYDQVVKKQNI